MSQSKTPNVVIETIGSERSFVCFVLIARKPCGRSANVVKNAATKPSIVMNVDSKICVSVKSLCQVIK